MSKTRLGLLVLWPAFWTGFPLKLAIGLLLLAAGLHPWEGAGLGFLLLLSVPIDIWALGLCARTLFLERLRVDPQPGLGLTLWWQWTIFNVIYLPILYFTVGAVASTSKSVAATVIELVKEHVWMIPVAEQISIELVMWGSVTTVVLLILTVGWLYGLGAIVQRHVRAAVQQEGTFQDMVHHWDLLRVPADQGLLLTAFTGTGVVLVFLFWGFLPTTTPHPHEEYEFLSAGKVEKPINPKSVLKKTEQVLAQAELTLKEKETGDAKGVKDGTSQKKAKPSGKTTKASGPNNQGKAVSAKSDDHSDDGHDHKH